MCKNNSKDKFIQNVKLRKDTIKDLIEFNLLESQLCLILEGENCCPEEEISCMECLRLTLNTIAE